MTASTFTVTPTRPLGVVVTGVDLADAAQPGGPLPAAALADLLARHGVVAVPGQDLDDAAFAAFLRRLGPLAFTAGETPVPGRDDLNVVSNVGRAQPPRSTFHVDTSYVRRPPAYTALRAVTIPRRGGDTLFSDQYRAHDTLPADLRERLAGRTVRHVVTGVDPGPGAETEAEHPVLRPHPRSGRAALYLTTPARCRSVSGLDEQEAAALVERLYAHSIRDDNVLRHRWAPGDVVIWDNGCVMHRADHGADLGDRVLHRGMVATYPGAA